jgi:hypothetical protein
MQLCFRPNLSSIIPNIIYGIESKVGLPEKYTTRSIEDTKKLLTERALEIDMNETLSSAEKYASVCQLGTDLGFSMNELIYEIHNGLLERYDDNGQSSAVELLSNLTPLSPMSVRNRRRSSAIGPAESISSRAGAKRGHDEGRLSQIRWDGLKKVVIEECSKALLLQPSFHPWRENEKQESLVKKLDANIMSTWGIFYCGGSDGVILDLREISLDFNVDLHIDSFAW